MKQQLPNNTESEKKVLSAVLGDNTAFDAIYRIIKPEQFFDQTNGEIFGAMTDMYDAQIPVDYVSIFEYSRKQKININASYLAELSGDVVSEEIAEYHAKIIYEKWLMRQTIQKSKDIINRAANNEDPFDLISDAIQNLENVNDSLEVIKTERNIGDELQAIFDSIREERETSSGLGWKTENFETFNKVTGGLQRGEMLVISGADKAGKTTFALSLLIDFVVNQDVAAAAFTLEMPFDQYSRKIISLATNTRYGYLRSPAERNNHGQYHFSEDYLIECVARSIRKFSEQKFFIIDEVIDDIGIKSKMKYLKRKHGIELFMVDYIGLVECKSKKERRDLEIAQVSRMLKQIAMELKVAVIVISQENDEGSTAESKALRRDCDFWFSISHPIDKGREQIKFEGNNYPIDHAHHVVTFKRSRHSPQGGIFFTYYFKGGEFKEIDIRYSEVNQ